ncbi:hypothetical protein GJ496_002520 [Pomphorhynchus laevis]|nr:hypothetical protein GJ496_002520 [Pomphorhynchus laevis]
MFLEFFVISDLENVKFMKLRIQSWHLRNLVPDCHNSEYIASRDKRISYISGFTGSNATIVITANKALLWTDGRYFDQAENQLSSEWTLMRDRNPGVLPIDQWLAEHFKSDEQVGYDPSLLTIAENTMFSKAGVHMKAISPNLVDVIWDADECDKRPEYNDENIFMLNLEHAGQSIEEKLKILRTHLHDENEILLVTALDEVAWLFNLRGNDIPYNPVFFSFAMVSLKCAHVYLVKKKLPQEVEDKLVAAGVKVENYNEFWSSLKDIPSSKILLSSTACVLIQNILGADKCKLLAVSPIAKLKAVKNEVEQQGMKQAHIKDAVAVCEFIFEVSKYPNKYDELTAENFRTISAYGANASVIHYGASDETNRPLGSCSFYLLDSGGQYLQGTTDITRTMHFALADAVFPTNISANRLDTIARKPLWDFGKDYGHGTGHGVGCFLNVHEGPFSISYRIVSEEGLDHGSVVSNEPGYYETGRFGIRIENLLLCQRSKVFPGFLCFEPLTLVPISKNSIDKDMLTRKEIESLNTYHRQVYDTIVPEMQKQGKSKELIDWLENQTKPISVKTEK